MTLPRVDVEIIPCRNEKAWLNERRKRVQASDGGKILVDNEAFAVYSDKVTPSLVSSRQEWQQIKLAMEAPVREIYQQKYGGKVHTWPAYTIAVSRELPWLACTPDSLVEDPERNGIGNHQIKCWSEFDKFSWRDSPPLYIQVQTQIEMKVLGVEWGVIAVMFGSQSLERFYVDPNPDFLAAALPILRDFYTCMELRQPPEIDGSAATTAALSRLHPNDNGLSVHLADDVDSQLGKLARVKSLLDRLEKRKSEIENRLRAELGDNTYGVTPAGKWVSWKSQSKSEVLMPATTYRVLRTHKAPPKELRDRAIEYADAPQEIDFRVEDRAKLPKWLKVKLLNQRGTCRWCGCQLTLNSATFEHVVALDVGGTNDESNIDLACAPCNQKRGSNSTLEVSRA
jgi:predicted phage-related endonuclease/5-methylcytosine-specific restriction endonuclease McrA